MKKLIIGDNNSFQGPSAELFWISFFVPTYFLVFRPPTSFLEFYLPTSFREPSNVLKNTQKKSAMCSVLSLNKTFRDVRPPTSFRNFCLPTSFTQTSRHFFKYTIKICTLSMHNKRVFRGNFKFWWKFAQFFEVSNPLSYQLESC